ncbi:hypothetical protein [Undibacterium sp. TJN19]|uniref:hypothetical protein n=1 Tax=Undibacterium sp. TJN19 TaxID=3413055 RepID=UPI003BF0156D
MQMRTRQDFPSLDQLLIDGGDGRIALHADGLNKYGCAALPQGAQSALFAFGSATASCISAPAYAAAARTYPQLLLAHQQQTEYAVYAREIDGVRHELKQLCGLGQRNDIDIVFAASGTDLHLIAAQLYASFSTEPTLVIMSDANETGSLVPLALALRHFSERTALGDQVKTCEHIKHAKELEVVNAAARWADGSVRDVHDIETEALINKAFLSGQAVILILVDVTKTGIMAPSIGTAIRLRKNIRNYKLL